MRSGSNSTFFHLDEQFADSFLCEWNPPYATEPIRMQNNLNKAYIFCQPISLWQMKASKLHLDLKSSCHLHSHNIKNALTTLMNYIYDIDYNLTSLYNLAKWVSGSPITATQNTAQIFKRKCKNFFRICQWNGHPPSSLASKRVWGIHFPWIRFQLLDEPLNMNIKGTCPTHKYASTPFLKKIKNERKKNL